MVFDYYGADLTPPELSDCMWEMACPFYWGIGAACSNGKATWVDKYPFDWNRLDQELNQNSRPIVLGMCRKGTCNTENPSTHWVAVVNGQGSDPANYYMHDPWYMNGANMKLSDRADDYEFYALAIYDGQATCRSSMSTFIGQSPVTSQSVRLASAARIANLDLQLLASGTRDLSASSTISGSVSIYRTTEDKMIVHLAAQSSAGNVTEMQLWTDSTPSATWQPFTSFAMLPISDFVYARFRDEFDNVSDVYWDTIHPVGPPDAPELIFLPLILNHAKK